MKRKSSIIKLSIIGAVIVIGFVLCFCPMKIGFWDFKGFGRSIKLGLDLKGGVVAVYDAQLTEDTDEDYDTAMDSTTASLYATLASRGYSESLVQREGNGIRVSIPNVESIDDVKRIIGNPAEIKFVLRGDNGVDTTVLTGKEVSSAVGVENATYGGPVVSLTLTSKGTKAFAEATAANIGKTMDIVKIEADGKESVIQSPKIESAITGGQAVISGQRSLETAQELAAQITAGKLSLKLSLKESSSISATLGASALKLGLLAGAIGMVLVIGILIYFYGLFGVAGAIALLIYTVLMIFFLAVFPWVQLTLPGIAGIILSIGMAIDGNIIIYERIKDEYRNGKSILSSSYYGFRRSILAIVDSNLTTILAGIVLYIFGTGPVKGFALMLLIGIVLSIFSALVVTRGLVKYFVNINQSNPKLYKLVRGKDYQELTADQNSALAQIQMDDEQRAKDEKKEVKTVSAEGGI